MALKIRRSVHKNTEPEIIYFESDEEFEDWAVVPYATIVETEYGRECKGDHSDAYKEAIQQGKYFYIKGGLDESKVHKRRCVTKRVSPDFQTSRETVRVELPVENLADSRMIMRSRVLAKRQAKELLTELLSGNQYDVDPCQIDKALDEARRGYSACQRIVTDILFYAERTEWFYSKLQPSDECWVEAQGDKRAACVLLVGMHIKYRRIQQSSTDIETGETFSYNTYEQTDGTLFEPDAAKEQELFAQLWDWEPSEYNDMVVASQLLFNITTLDVTKMLKKLADEGVPEAACEIAEVYRYGNERSGIYANRAKAKHYYEIAGEEFDEFEDLDDDFPDDIDYTIKGAPATLAKLRAIIDELCPLHGKPHRPQFEIEMAADNELKCLLPLLPLMERLVGEVDGIYYFGYIMSIKTIDEQTLLLRVEAKRTEGLYYALRQTFPELQVVYKTISYLDKN
jgi:hypothetical protein